MDLPHRSHLPDRATSGPSGRMLALATGAAVGLGALAWMIWTAEQRTLSARPRDSAPARARKAGLAERSAISVAATIAAPRAQIIDGLAGAPDGTALARDLVDDAQAAFRPIEHHGDDVVSWRTEDDAWRVKLVLRPVRDGRMTAVTAIVARADDSPVFFRSGARSRLTQALTRFRMGFETGELARAH